MSNKMYTNINFSLERVEGKRLIISGFFTEFPFDGFLEIPKHNINRFDLQGSGKYPKIFTSNIRCIGNSILGLVGFPHIRRLCGNTKIIRRVFPDKLVGYLLIHF